MVQMKETRRVQTWLGSHNSTCSSNRTFATEYPTLHRCRAFHMIITSLCL